MNGMVLPYAAGTSNVVITSRYGMRRHPIRGDLRFHSGIDIATPAGRRTPIRTIAGGTVIYSGTAGGFGQVVAVRTPENKVEMFAHLDWRDVQVGQVLQPGRFIGREGNTGLSTGQHLHFNVYRAGTPTDQIFNQARYQETTINPEEYMRQMAQATIAPASTGGSAAAQANVQAVRGVGNGYVTDPSNVANMGSPLRSGRASVNRADYPAQTPATANHGYPQLDPNRDRAGRYRATVLNNAANRLNIPGQWLADIIHFESAGTWSPSVRHDNGRGIGLIGFHQSGGLGDVAQAMGVNTSTAMRRLAGMTFQQQMEWVVFYIEKYTTQQGRSINSIEELYGLIHQGPNSLRRDAQQRASTAYRDSLNGQTFNRLLIRLGQDVGRRYQTSYDNLQSSLVPHTGHIEGCPICAQMLLYNNEVSPHYA